MIASWLGRSFHAVPALLAAIGVGSVVAGVTGDPSLAVGAATLLAVAALTRISSTGVLIDLEGSTVTLRSFWRTHRLKAEELRRVDAGRASDADTAGLRLETVDGREFLAPALAYLRDDPAEQLIDQFRALEARSQLEVRLHATSFRRCAHE